MKRPANQKVRVLGIMSGTSIDSVDLALCRFYHDQNDLLDLKTVPFPKTLRARLHRAAAGSANSYETGQLHHDLGRFYAKAALPFKNKCDLVGLHGQTIYHNPNPADRATFQIGEPKYLAVALGLPVYANFRTADIAAGGQGAPLATALHARLFSLKKEHVAVQNLGGIGNVTSLDWTRGALKILSFDTGPANVLLDLTCRHFSGGRRHFDRNGTKARSGRINNHPVSRWLTHKYFRQPPPKSTGRELFGEPFFHRLLATHNWSEPDLLATLTEFTARNITQSYADHLPSIPAKIVLCGGGARNKFLRERLEALLPNSALLSTDALGWPVESIEAAAFAFLAWLRHHQIPGNIPETTGAKKAVLLGELTSP